MEVPDLTVDSELSVDPAPLDVPEALGPQGLWL